MADSPKLLVNRLKGHKAWMPGGWEVENRDTDQHRCTQIKKVKLTKLKKSVFI
jgi:hypothetical protein